MTTPAAIFDSGMARWTEEQGSLWSQLKYRLVHVNLSRHVSTASPLRVLDAGGGNGGDAIPLATQGHRVVIVDYSTAMLADATRRAAAAQMQEQVTVYQARLVDVPTLFPDPAFDVVLCHNVLQYVDDVHTLLTAILSPLKPGGIVSIISVNRYSNPYHAAFLYGNLEEAFRTLEHQDAVATIFGATMHLYTAEEIMDMLTQSGCSVDAHDGIRCLCDYWGDNERKSDPAVFAQIERLELALANKYPYKLLARYFQIVAHKL
jgi:S-adenosylmethionine-dependent methyltransferase